MPLFHGFIEIAHGADAQDFLPRVVLFKQLEHLVLLRYLGQLRRIVQRRDAQQQAVKIGFQSKKIELTRVGEQRTVVEVYVVVNLIIRGVELSRAFQQLSLGLVTTRSEHLYGRFGGHFETSHGHSRIDNGLHALANVRDVGSFERATEVYIHKITVGNRYVNHHITLGIAVVHGFAQHKEQRACVVS